MNLPPDRHELDLARLRAVPGMEWVGGEAKSLPTDAEASLLEANFERLADELFAVGGQALPFGQIFPGLEGLDGMTDRPLTEGLSSRASNCLRRAGFERWGQLSETNLGELSALPNFGTKTGKELIVHVAAAWYEASPRLSQQPPEGRTAQPMRENVESAASNVSVYAWRELDEHIRWAWREQGATLLKDALVLATDGMPEALSARSERFLDRPISEVVDVPRCDEEVWSSLIGDDYREQDVLDSRTVASGPKATLDELGRRYDVTRERIRQIENRVVERLERVAQGDARVKHLVARVLRDAGELCSIAHMERVLAELVVETSDDGLDAPTLDLRARLLAHVAGGWDDWHGLRVHRPSRVREAFSEVVEATQIGEVVDDASVGRVLEAAVDDRHRRDLMTELGLRELEGRLLRWGGALPDKGVAALRFSGEPMSMYEIHQWVGVEANPRSLANAVGTDPRVMRRGRDKYGLREWGGEEYSGILEEIEQRIERAGGPVSVADLVQEFVRDFDVSETSVRGYANDPRFERLPGGLVGFRAGEHPEFDSRKYPLDLAGGCFNIDGSWFVRIRVDHDLLRGSGKATKRAVAVGFGLEPGLSIAHDIDGHSVSATWRGVQPTMGSVRSILLERDCVEGDLLFLPLPVPSPGVAAFVVRRTSLDSTDDTRRLAAEVGIAGAEIADDDPFEVAAVLALPPSADWGDVRDRLVARRESDLAALIPEEWVA